MLIIKMYKCEILIISYRSTGHDYSFYDIHFTTGFIIGAWKATLLESVGNINVALYWITAIIHLQLHNFECA